MTLAAASQTHIRENQGWAGPGEPIWGRKAAGVPGLHPRRSNQHRLDRPEHVSLATHRAMGKNWKLELKGIKDKCRPAGWYHLLQPKDNS